MLISDLHFPEDLRYDLRHMWVRTVGDDAVIGVTDYAQSLWGGVGFVQLPEADAELLSGQAVGQASCALAGPCDLFTPLSGTVIAVNGLVEEDPTLVNSDPYGEGWLLRLEPSEPAQLRDLMDAGTYRRALMEAPPASTDALLAGIFHYSVDPMLFIDRHRRIVAMNPAAERLTGRRAQSVIGSTQCFHLFRCEVGGEELHGIDCLGIAAHEGGKSAGCIQVRCEDGGTALVSASYSPIPRENGGGPLTLITMRVLNAP